MVTVFVIDLSSLVGATQIGLFLIGVAPPKEAKASTKLCYCLDPFCHYIFRVMLQQCPQC